MKPLYPRALRSAFGTFMTGVTVVTAHGKNAEPLGFTANSFTSVSLDPPLLLVCLANSSQNYDALIQSKGFAVNVLAEDQIEVSNTFARPVADRFASVGWKPGPQGSPILNGVTAWFDCSMHKIVDAGDHVILIGQVEAFEATESPGLGYARGAYVSPSASMDALGHGTNLIVSALIERDGQILLLDDDSGGQALPEGKVGDSGTAQTLSDLITSTGLRAEPGFIYSVFEDVLHKRQHISFLCQAAEGDPTRGVFVPLHGSALDDITDPAVLTMVKRFAAEHQIGDYGVYFGDNTSGKVRPLSKGN